MQHKYLLCNILAVYIYFYHILNAKCHKFYVKMLSGEAHNTRLGWYRATFFEFKNNLIYK